MKKISLIALAATMLTSLNVTQSSAHTPGCIGGSSPHWYAFAAATGSENSAYNAAGQLGETQVQDIQQTNSPNHDKNLWLVYRGWFDSEAQASGELSYFRANGFSDAFVKKLCMWEQN